MRTAEARCRHALLAAPREVEALVCHVPTQLGHVPVASHDGVLVVRQDEDNVGAGGRAAPPPTVGCAGGGGGPGAQRAGSADVHASSQ